MKRKRVVVSVQEKLTAIKRLNKGVSLRSVAKNYGVGISTVSEWRKNRKKKIEQWCSVLAFPAPQRKCMKKGEYKKIQESLYLWFTQQRGRGIPISYVLFFICLVMRMTFYFCNFHFC
jgi:transposase-like protein